MRHSLLLQYRVLDKMLIFLLNVLCFIHIQTLYIKLILDNLWNHCGKWRNCSYEQFLHLPHWFQLYKKVILHVCIIYWVFLKKIRWIISKSSAIVSGKELINKLTPECCVWCKGQVIFKTNVSTFFFSFNISFTLDFQNYRHILTNLQKMTFENIVSRNNKQLLSLPSCFCIYSIIQIFHSFTFTWFGFHLLQICCICQKV